MARSITNISYMYISHATESACFYYFVGSTS